MSHMRSRALHCGKCNCKAYVVANLDSGKVHSVTLPEGCQYPATCKQDFVRGVFDRQFGARIIVPRFGGRTG
jgi:hypothetical protein